MAVQLDQNVKDDLKTQFITREGTYRLMTLSEYSRPNRVGYTNNQSSPQVRVSIVSLPNSSNGQQQQSQATAGGGDSSVTEIAGRHSNFNNSAIGGGISSGSIDSRLGGMPMHLSGEPNCSGSMYGGDRICFNFGKELYVYAFRGVKKGSELSKPIDKKLYKGTNPSCHDFNATNSTPDGAPLLVGFTTGQIQLVQPGRREQGKLYNEERLIDKTKVTCLKWLPGSPNLFLASHSSGHLYLYNEELPCTPTAPNYQPFKMGDGYTILTCKSKSTRNPLYKWIFNTENCSINEFCFSPCGSNLAIVSQDGFLRVFHYDTMELLGIARSYFGGFLCVCWSPDGKYIVVGGEDDLVTVWSLHERRVVARGQGHRSWVSVVAFDPYTTSYTNWDGPDFSDDENPINDYSSSSGQNRFRTTSIDSKTNDENSSRRLNSSSFRDSIAPSDKLATSYRLGSVSQDTQLCLWDITEDVLRHPLSLRQRLNSTNASDNPVTTTNSTHYLNGDLVNDVKVIKPIAITTVSGGNNGGPNMSNLTKDNDNSNSSKNSSNSSSSKFSTANCTISSTSSTTVPNDAAGGGAADSGVGGSSSNEATVAATNRNNSINSSSISISNSSKQNSNLTKLTNCINANKSDSIDSSSGVKSSSGGASNSSTKSSESSGLSALNSLTQRLSNFSFGSDKKSADNGSSNHPNHHNHHNSRNQNHNHHRKTFSLTKSSGSYYTSSSSSTTNHTAASATVHGSSASSGDGAGKSSAIVTSYDPMKLIGTPACPRFDECPLLEPLISKKIAHERLTALIFREDCFLTACQDGFIYTWARPGFSNVPQHMSPSPSAPPGGTVV